jgi:hypothetical protein
VAAAGTAKTQLMMPAMSAAIRKPIDPPTNKDGFLIGCSGPSTKHLLFKFPLHGRKQSHGFIVSGTNL